MKNASTLGRPSARFWIWLCLALVLLLVAVVRLRLIDVPLERDEGEYAYTGQLILQGIAPFKLAYTMKLPGTSTAYALLMTVFGQTTTGIHIGLMLVNAGSILMVFCLARKLFDPLAGLVAAASYAVMSTSQSVLGLAAHANHFVVLFVLAGVNLLLRGTADRRTFTLFASGTCFGLACLMKQHGIFYGLFALAFLMGAEFGQKPADWRWAARRLANFSAALVLPFMAVCLVLFWAGTFKQFLFWTLTYAREYAVAPSLSEGWANLGGVLPEIIGPNLPLWILSLIGLVLVVVTKPMRAHRLFLLGFLLSSTLAVCPGLCFRPHYFILLLPALALFAGAALWLTRQLLAGCPQFLGTGLPLGISALLITDAVFQQGTIWFSMSSIEVCREAYGHEPFPESVMIADYIRERSASADRIAVLGSEPQIYFYAKRRSATGCLYTFPLMESHPFAAEMQTLMIREIEHAQPRYVVYIQNTILWLKQSNSPTRIFEWADEYLTKYYSLDGVADPVARDRTEYRWGTAAADYKPESEFYTLVYKRTAQ
jgi:hypothetical protein